jgi:hypothetical protein
MQFAEIMQQNELLAKENRLFDSFLQRNASLAAEQLHQEKSKASSRRAHARPAPAHEPTITDAEKHRIGVEELEYRTLQLSALEQKASEDISLLKAITSGIAIRINEMRKETYEFQRDIVVGGENARTGAIMAERVLRYFEDKLRLKHALVEKLRLKNKAMKAYRQKMDAAVRHKEEQGDSLHSIDFHQLQIKNSQFNQKIKERNDELLKLKMTTGKTVQILNTLKKTLNDLLHDSKVLRKELKEKDAAKQKLSEELSRVEREVRSESSRNSKYKIQQSNPDMPQVMDYVTQKSIMYELEGAARNWARKVEIVEMAAKRARRVLSKAGVTAHAATMQRGGSAAMNQQRYSSSAGAPHPTTFSAYSAASGTDAFLPKI